MTKAKILTSIEKISEYLDLVGINYNYTPKRKVLEPSKYSAEYFQVCHNGNYEAKYLIASKNSDFDIQLEDSSFFQFTYSSSTSIHYSFVHRIELVMSYQDFVDKYLTEENIDSIAQEYEMYLSTDKRKAYPCPIRYDVAKSEYKESLHAYAHLHIGIETDIRIPIDKILTPLEFVDFVIKHIYKEKWDNAYIHKEKFRKLVESLKKQSIDIDINNFSEKEKLQLFIT